MLQIINKSLMIAETILNMFEKNEVLTMFWWVMKLISIWIGFLIIRIVIIKLWKILVSYIRDHYRAKKGKCGILYHFPLKRIKLLWILIDKWIRLQTFLCQNLKYEKSTWVMYSSSKTDLLLIQPEFFGHGLVILRGLRIHPTCPCVISSCRGHLKANMYKEKLHTL